jgi:hypothetical protein
LQQLPFFQNAQLLQQLPPVPPIAPPAPPIAPPAPPIAPPNPSPGRISAPPSPSKTFRLTRPISSREFCDRYNISAADEAKLSKLEFVPGEREIEALGREDWQDEAKFSKLGWGRFLTKHKQFIADVMSGAWDLLAADPAQT